MQVAAASLAEDRSAADLLRTMGGLDLIALVDRAGGDFSAGRLIEIYTSWIQWHGDDADCVFAVWHRLGVQYGLVGDTANQIAAFKNALAIKPDLYDAAITLGRYFELDGHPDLALALWEKALQPDVARLALLNNSGRVLEAQNRLDEAERKYIASLLIDPNQSDVLHHWIGLRTRMCLWPVYAALPGLTSAAVLDATRGLTLLALHDDAALLARANRSWIVEHLPPAPERLVGPQPYRHRKVRIGYMSSDFCNHPIAFLIAELFELHDRDQFEVHGYCSTKDDGSEVRRRILKAFETCTDIRGMSDEQAARAIRAAEIDVLIDLNGLTLGTRLGVLRWKPAPVQMTYLGYNGPIDVPELDYMIADAFVIPPAIAENYRPAPLYMRRCFQVNDSTLPVAPPSTRQDAGLPEGAFVFCCFSNTYKVTEPVFDAWLEILRRTDRSVLWLYVDNRFAMDNLRARAARAGIADDRLVFAARVDPAHYRSRLALADLFLDTYPYNAGTTASDALRVGLPIITMSGESFTSRMAGSLLTAMELDDAIVRGRDAYVDLAVALATDPVRYKTFRARVTSELWRQTLGDTSRFCAEFEGALKEAVSLWEDTAGH